MPKIAKAFLRTRKHYELWQELQDAIDEADEQVPCVSYPDLFFGDDWNSAIADLRIAKNMCRRCPIMLQCAVYGLEAEEEYGVWGGLTPLDRKKMRRDHGAYRKAAESVTVRFRQSKRDGIQGNQR